MTRNPSIAEIRRSSVKNGIARDTSCSSQVNLKNVLANCNSQDELRSPTKIKPAKPAEVVESGESVLKNQDKK